MRGFLIAFEGLDQSGKQTQAETLIAALTSAGRSCELLSFPDYQTAIGGEIHRALHGEHDYPADVMQLLYVANRYETRKRIDSWLSEGRVILSDRYTASSMPWRSIAPPRSATSSDRSARRRTPLARIAACPARKLPICWWCSMPALTAP